jgi:S-adenosylmethionine synthetase
MEPFGTGKIASKEIARLIFEHFNLRSGIIIRDLEECRQGRVAEKR